MIREPVPEPDRIRAYLSSHGWTGEACPDPEVEVFTFSETSDDGQPITVFVPGSADIATYPLCVANIVTTVAAIEDRSKEAVWAELRGEKRPHASRGWHALIREQVSEPDRIRAYLSSHGWTGEDSPDPEVEMFTFSKPSNDGHPITVFVPGSSDIATYPLCVDAVVTTVAWVEDRPKEAILADILAGTVEPRTGDTSRPETNGESVENTLGVAKP